MTEPTLLTRAELAGLASLDGYALRKIEELIDALDAAREGAALQHEADLRVLKAAADQNEALRRERDEARGLVAASNVALEECLRQRDEARARCAQLDREKMQAIHDANEEVVEARAERDRLAVEAQAMREALDRLSDWADGLPRPWSPIGVEAMKAAVVALSAPSESERVLRDYEAKVRADERTKYGSWIPLADAQAACESARGAVVAKLAALFENQVAYGIHPDSRHTETIADTIRRAYAIAATPPSAASEKCDDCGAVEPLITKPDHHGGMKTVCADRDACHGRSRG